ncbi:MAG: molybdate ABC transporter substrate-binding protein [Vicinamibacterales bacterium]
MHLYGRAAVDAFRKAGLYDWLRGQLVLGENVAQAAQFAQTGSADVAVIALSLTLAPAMKQVGTAVEIAPDAFAPIRQTGVVLTRSTNPELAIRFLEFLSQPDIAQLLRTAGFGPRP